MRFGTRQEVAERKGWHMELFLGLSFCGKTRENPHFIFLSTFVIIEVREVMPDFAERKTLGESYIWSCLEVINSVEV